VRVVRPWRLVRGAALGQRDRRHQAAGGAVTAHACAHERHTMPPGKSDLQGKSSLSGIFCTQMVGFLTGGGGCQTCYAILFIGSVLRLAAWSSRLRSR
jgi:hypothetical protein